MTILTRASGWLLTLALVMVSGLAVVLFLDSRPLIPEPRALTLEEQTWAQDWLRSARPRGRAEPITLALTEPQANILLAYLIDRLGEGRARVELLEARARITASIELPLDAGGRFVNLDLELSGAGRPPRVEQLRLAGLPLPETLAQGLAGQALEALDRGHLLQSLAIERGRIWVTYAWGPESLASLGRDILSPEGWERVLGYQALIQAETQRRRVGQAVPLAPLLSHLLAAAEVRSRGGDPVTENRAAILALAAYGNRRHLPQPSDPSQGPGSQQRPPAPAFRPLVLGGRVDLAQHFLTSAAISAQGGDALAELLGLYKELADSRGGSGFSFADLAADQAGSRFSRRAVGSTEGAMRVQAIARRGLSESDFMPSIDGLPEGMDPRRLASGFSHPADPSYRRLASQIERRIDALPLHEGTVN